MNTEITLVVSELKAALPGLSKVIGRSRTLPVLQTVRVTRNDAGKVSIPPSRIRSIVEAMRMLSAVDPPSEGEALLHFTESVIERPAKARGRAAFSSRSQLPR